MRGKYSLSRVMENIYLEDYIMLRIDKSIMDTNNVICRNIACFDASERGLLSQNILAQTRNFVEYIAMKACSNGSDIDPNDYDYRVNALERIKTMGNMRFLYVFHDMLQKSVSHYTVDEEGSERLMLKYYEHLLKVKAYLKNTFGMEVLANIEDFPLNTDTELIGYYTKIAERIERPSGFKRTLSYSDRYYIQKIKPFFIDQRIYYEVTFSAANTRISKFDRLIAFTDREISDCYAVKLELHSDVISVLGRDMEIEIIDNWTVSIRPCEINNFSKIFGPSINVSTSSHEYRELMHYLTRTRVPLDELVKSDKQYYYSIRDAICAIGQTTKIFGLLDKCRSIIACDKKGSVILRYLLHKMNNKIIKHQLDYEPCEKLSNLRLSYKCIPFEEMPYCSSLVQHNPRIHDLYDVIDPNGREHELFARKIKNNTEIEGILFTPEKEIEGFDNLDELIDTYNGKLYYKHQGRMILRYKKHLYIAEYVEDSAKIMNMLNDYTSSGISQYTSSVDSWLANLGYSIDDPSKVEIIRQMFSDSKVAIIYGSAGTGKSTLVGLLSNFFAGNRKLYLANTHPAVDNLQRRVSAGNSSFSTIASFISSNRNMTDCDVLFIDECSTVSNSDMRKILEKATFKLLVLVGDIYQIESITFGNWFTIAQNFIPQKSVFELVHPFRTHNDTLLTVWNRVRDLDYSILEPMVKNSFSARLDESIFTHTDEDEIVLCLNYDGLYGINNINRFLQNCNPNIPVQWGINYYKIGDPILFNETNMFSPLIHNNSKGRIAGICVEDTQIWFDIELDRVINGFEAERYSFQLVGLSQKGNSIIRFCVNKLRSTDEDDDDNDTTTVPFQVAYAVSIHKAQGLEYESVKIIITNETEERITHSIFYTAITRAKDRLKIYWSPETEKAVLERLEVKSTNKDSFLLSSLKSLQMISKAKK